MRPKLSNLAKLCCMFVEMNKFVVELAFPRLRSPHELEKFSS